MRHHAQLRNDIRKTYKRHRRPQRVARCKHPVMAMRALSGRWNERGQPVQKLKRRQIYHPCLPGLR